MTTTRRLLAAGLTLLIGALAVLLPASPASAYRYWDYNRPGAVSVPTAQGVHIRQCTTYYYLTCRMAPGIHHEGMRIYRSQATSGRQDVVVFLRVEHWRNGSWNVVDSQVWQDPIYAGQSSVLKPAWTSLPSRVGYWRVTSSVLWYANGQRLGQRDISYDHQGDYACATTLRTCTPGPGWIYMLEPGT